MGPPKKKANSAGKRRRISEETVNPRNDEVHDQSTVDPAMLQSITADVTESVLDELKKAGIIMPGQSQLDTQSITQPGVPPNHAHSDQHEDNALSQTTAPPDEAQQRA